MISWANSDLQNVLDLAGMKESIKEGADGWHLQS